jgi:hypothetical protein
MEGDGMSNKAPLMSNWQPIETAPKDGKPILLWLDPPLEANAAIGWLPCDLTVVVGWHDDDLDFGASGWKCGICYEGCGDSYGNCPAVDIDLTPTHWMPHPEPPWSEK